jgi:hypothetical protein
MKYLIIIILLFGVYNSFSQCACIGGAAVGGLTPIGGTANIGVLQKNYIRANIFYRYSFGDKYLNGDSPAQKVQENSYRTQFTGFSLAYGATDNLTIESGLGYFPETYQDYVNDTSLKSSGFSHLMISAKYNVYSSIMNEFEFTAGAGIRLPMPNSKKNLLQQVQPSTGAYGIVVNSFLHKGYKKQGLHFFLINSANINFENNNNFKYGNSFYNSFYTTKTIVENISAYVEIRNEIRLKDKFQTNDIKNSGGIFFFLSPQINYSINKFNFSIFYDYPIYQNVNDKQLGNNYSFGANITYQFKI